MKISTKISMNRDNLIKIGAVIVIIIFAVVGIKGCNDDKQVENAINNVTIEKNKVNEVVLSMEPAKTLNPLVSTDEDVFYISKLIYSSLFTFDENMKPIGDLAKSYSFSGDTLTIKLNSAKWHDGKSVDADDVAFTFDAIKAIGKDGGYYEKIDKIESVSGSGSNLKVTFKDSSDMSLSYLSFPILPEHKFDSTYDLKSDTEDFKPVGSGMFKFKSYDATKEMKLSKNENYYGEKAVSDLRIRVVKASSNKTKMAETSNITVFFDKRANREAKITKKDIKIKNFVSNQLEYIGFNFNNELLTNKNLRKAIAYGLDVDKIIEENYYNSLKQSDSLYYPEYLGSTKLDKPYEYSIDDASKLLKDEKFADENDDKILDSEDGKALKFKLIVNKNNKNRVGVAEELKDSLKSLGIDIEISQLDTKAYQNALKKGNFDLYIGGMILDESMDMRNLLKSDGEFNYTKYTDEKVDGYLDDLFSGNTDEENLETVNKLKEYLNEELPYYCIGYKTYGIVKSPVFNGDLTPNFVNPYSGINSWYCEYEKRVEDDTEVETPSTEASE